MHHSPHGYFANGRRRPCEIQGPLHHDSIEVNTTRATTATPASTVVVHHEASSSGSERETPSPCLGRNGSGVRKPRGPIRRVPWATRPEGNNTNKMIESSYNKYRGTRSRSNEKTSGGVSTAANTWRAPRPNDAPDATWGDPQDQASRRPRSKPATGMRWKPHPTTRA